MPLPFFSSRERALICFFAVLLLVAVIGPVTLTPKDIGGWHRLPGAMDLITVLPLLALGLWGIRWLRWLDQVHESVQDMAVSPSETPPPGDALDCAWLFFAGLVLTAAGSAIYHSQPDSLRLAADHVGSAVAFSGLIGVAVCERVSARAGWPIVWFTLAGGLLAVAIRQETGNELPWALAQFGGLALALLLSLAKPVHGAVGLKMGWVVLFYALAKLFELSDEAIYESTHRMLSGQSLKHLAVATATLPVLHALQTMGRRSLRHNPGAAAVTA